MMDKKNKHGCNHRVPDINVKPADKFIERAAGIWEQRNICLIIPTIQPNFLVNKMRYGTKLINEYDSVACGCSHYWVLRIT